MFAEVHRQDFRLRAQSRDIPELHDLYLTVGRGRAPHIAAFDVPLLERYARNLMRLEPLADGSYRYTHYGQDIAEIAAFDMTGHTTADFEGPQQGFFEAVYRESAQTQAPLFTIHRAVKASMIHTWEGLVLPVLMDDGATAFIVYNRPREFAQDFLQSMLNVLPDGIVALRAMRQADGMLTDAQIISLNPAAIALMDEAGEGSLLRSTPLLSGAEVWTALQNVILWRDTANVDLSREVGGETRHIRAQITPLFDGALVHLADITALKFANLVLEREHQQLRSEISRQQDEGDVLRGLAHSDPLTGALNRRGLFAAADEWSRRGCERTVIAVDIDQFKHINDRHGHGAGDDVLRQVAAILLDVTGDADGFLGRPGGDEFVCVLPYGLDEAMQFAERARVRVQVSPVATSVGPAMITCSFGVAGWGAGLSIDAALQAADGALYRAKKSGRNCVVAGSSDALALMQGAGLATRAGRR
jgi:diguanylate cyclase (GGDEF)-like protein